METTTLDVAMLIPKPPVCRCLFRIRVLQVIRLEVSKCKGFDERLEGAVKRLLSALLVDGLDRCMSFKDTERRRVSWVTG